MKTLCAAVLGLVVVSSGPVARADDTAKLLGKWEVTKSGGDVPVGSTVEFLKDGKMTANVTLDGKELKITGTYKLAGDKLKMDLVVNEQKVDHEFTVKFGKDELTLEDADKKVDVLKKK